MNHFVIAGENERIRESEKFALVAMFWRMPNKIFVVFPNLDIGLIRERIQEFTLLSGFTYSGYLYTVAEYNQECCEDSTN